MILSFRPNSAALPYLEGPPNSKFRYASEDRLALERIYRDKGFLGAYLSFHRFFSSAHEPYTFWATSFPPAIEQTKWLMETRAIRPLDDYADMMAKIVRCRDIFQTAWKT